METTDRPVRHSAAPPRRHSVALLVTIALALLVFVPACTSSPNPAAAPLTTSSTTAAKATSTTSPVTLPEQNPAELVACTSDAKALQVALDAYMALKGEYPTPPSPWSAATYALNYQPLTSASGGGPFLQSALGTKYYVIEYDSAGQVWVAPPGTYGPYDKGQDFALQPNICQPAVG